MALALQDAGIEQPLVRLSNIEFVDPGRPPRSSVVHFQVSDRLTDWQAQAIAHRNEEGREPPEPFTLALDGETGRAWMKGQKV